MLEFPEGCYGDVRLERRQSTRLLFVRGALEEAREREEAGAFLRLHDGRRWTHGGSTALDDLQGEMRRLAAFVPAGARPPALPFAAAVADEAAPGADLRAVPWQEKEALLRALFPLLEGAGLLAWQVLYVDEHRETEFTSSAGARLRFARQHCGIRVHVLAGARGRSFGEAYGESAGDLAGLAGLDARVAAHVDACAAFVRDADIAGPRSCPVLLSPFAAGVFAHECFGHRSEADMPTGAEEAWCAGAEVGPPSLSIVDDGRAPGCGYTPYDDEGTPGGAAWLVREGRLGGRLHSVETAAACGAAPTGNARAVGFEFEPIVRMTTTAILPGPETREALLAGMDDGVYVDSVKSGSGIGAFTLAPSRSYRIRGGRLAGPVRVALLRGTVAGALAAIDGIAGDARRFAFVGAGCGKGAQRALPVGFGGPHVRLRALEVL